MDCHRKTAAEDGRRANSVRERMDAAKAKDKSSSTTLNALKEKLHMKPIPDEWSEPTKVVDFLLLKSLPDEAPIVVRQVLGKGSNVAEILWDFNRCMGEKRITLKQNPHFYKGLPRKKEAYGDAFRSDPMESFLDTPEVYVLTDRPSRVYLQSGQDARAFGNVWLPNNAIIFKDVCGKVEGESIVGASIQSNPKLRYRVEPLQPTTSTNAVPWEPLQDWREPIRRTLNSKDISIRISAEQPKSLRSLQISSSTSGHSTLGSSNLSKQATSGTALYSSAHTQPLPAVTARVPLSHVTSQSASLSQPSLTISPSTESATPEPVPSHRTPQSASPSQSSLTTSPSTDSAILEPVTSHRTSRSASPSRLSLTISPSTDSATPEPVPSHGISQSASSYQPSLITLPSMASATPEPVPSTVSTPRSATRRQEETPDLSRKPDSEDPPSPLSVAVTSQSVKASPPHNPAGGRDAGSGGNAHVQPNVTSIKLEATKITPLNPDGKPPSLQAHATRPGQGQGGWQFWFQGSVWRR